MTLFAAVAALAAFFYLLFILPTQWLKVERVRYPIGIRKRILQISDIHVDMLRISPNRLQKLIRSEQPDYIFLTGDFTYKESWLPRLDEYLRSFAESGVPVYAVPGNHDHKLPRLGKLTALFRKHRIPLLRNDSLKLPEFVLVGIDNFSTGHSMIKRSFRRVTAGMPIIVITHDPTAVLHIEMPFDYLMAGHFHGKQVNLPFMFKLKPKGELAAKGIFQGLHRKGRGAYYISKGIGQAGINLRLFVRSEVTIHEL